MEAKIESSVILHLRLILYAILFVLVNMILSICHLFLTAGVFYECKYFIKNVL
jgi:hypothetical protein